VVGITIRYTVYKLYTVFSSVMPPLIFIFLDIRGRGHDKGILKYQKIYLWVGKEMKRVRFL
jgi:hypothetical protein